MRCMICFVIALIVNSQGFHSAVPAYNTDATTVL